MSYKTQSWREMTKQALLLARSHPSGEKVVKQWIREELSRNASLNDPMEIKRSFHRNRYRLQEMEQFIKFHRYRWLRKHYGSTGSP